MDVGVTIGKLATSLLSPLMIALKLSSVVSFSVPWATSPLSHERVGACPAETVALAVLGRPNSVLRRERVPSFQAGCADASVRRLLMWRAPTHIPRLVVSRRVRVAVQRVLCARGRPGIPIEHHERRSPRGAHNDISIPTASLGVFTTCVHARPGHIFLGPGHPVSFHYVFAIFSSSTARTPGIRRLPLALFARRLSSGR